jgi:hypothetical protein
LIIGQIFAFLSSEAGNKLAADVVGFFKDWKSQAVRLEKHSAIWRNISQLGTMALVLGVALYAACSGKMDPVLAGLLGTLAGYALGKKT